MMARPEIRSLVASVPTTGRMDDLAIMQAVEPVVAVYSTNNKAEHILSNDVFGLSRLVIDAVDSKLENLFFNVTNVLLAMVAQAMAVGVQMPIPAIEQLEDVILPDGGNLADIIRRVYNDGNTPATDKAPSRPQGRPSTKDETIGDYLEDGISEKEVVEAMKHVMQGKKSKIEKAKALRNYIKTNSGKFKDKYISYKAVQKTFGDVFTQSCWSRAQSD